MHAGRADAVRLDTRALLEPADRETIRAGVRQLERDRLLPPGVARYGRGLGCLGVALFAILWGVLLLILVGGAGGIIAILIAAGAPAYVPLMIGGWAVFLVAVIAVSRRRRQTGERWWRLERFARANGMTWRYEDPRPQLPGLLFAVGRSHTSTDLVDRPGTHPATFANHSYTTGSTRHPRTHRWGYVAVRLSAPLPHIVLDAKGNDSLFSSTLPVALARSQRVSLEGDFDRHFTLYCPAGYEADARYLFPPDIMARFIDRVALLDVEIVDDWLLLYSRRPLVTLDPATWEWLVSVVDALEGKIGQWDRWRDGRLLPADTAPEPVPPPKGVAAAGTRLRRARRWVPVAALGAILAALTIAQLLMLAA
ncbi:hypothetical protein [Microbacterium sp. SORGH_AS_0888]|uniref:hypothetical protein n=1 Tax=Microbacterium sp. SORGH_AS_0888 TaxID=3041791 RepID=UPI0027D8E1A5|nr:hypothetical protein [Microbacterium sp. SORGH_AS_0888]